MFKELQIKILAFPTIQWEVFLSFFNLIELLQFIKTSKTMSAVHLV